MREVTLHTMDYIDVATTGILTPDVLPVEDLREMLSHIEDSLPSTMHLPISSEDTLHFYRYLCTHILIVDEEFLLLIDVPIQNHAQQVEIYGVFNLDIPHGNVSAHHDMQNKNLGITHDKTSTVEISEDQFQTCRKANRQFCILNTPLPSLANPSTCVSALYAKDKMFLTDQEGQQHRHTIIHISKCLDNDFTIWSIYHHYPMRSFTNRWSAVMDKLTHLCLLMSQ